MRLVSQEKTVEVIAEEEMLEIPSIILKESSADILIPS